MKKYFSVPIDDELLDRIHSIVQRWNMTKTSFAYQALNDLLEQLEKTRPPWEKERKHGK